ncbi:carboxypeptidase-like regulatory domain-containing protein [Deinococcus sonorensis]|uniref:Carboxypeptidase-like regulatory domain-containing protein n=2 Tax=Deinococcus sonorensis TaxID=309891 RepID=A0AAU7UA34_9DEIO
MTSPVRSLSVSLLMLACTVPLALAVPTVRPGYAVGRITRPDGQPVAGAVVRVEGTNDLGGLQSFTANTDAQGYYEQRLVGGIYRIQAWVPRSYNGVTGYILSAEPTQGGDDDEFDTHKGGIRRDFVWKTQGLKPGRQPGPGKNYYGGWGQVLLGSPKSDDRPAFARFPTDARVELTFTPAGPLVDGRTGRAVTVTLAGVNPKTLSEVNDWGSAALGTYQDMPTGRYTVTARFITPAGAVPARVGAYVMSGAVGGATVWLAPAAQQVIQWQPNLTDLTARSVQDINLYVLP